MRRLPRLAIALLTPCLVAGTCEFRATSNTGVRPPPEEQPGSQDGLTVVVSVGTDDGSSTSALPVDTNALLATSVLTSGGDASPPKSADATPALAEGTSETLDAPPPRAVGPPTAPRTITNAVPEPGAALLFAVGLGVVAWRGRRAARPKV